VLDCATFLAVVGAGIIYYDELQQMIASTAAATTAATAAQQAADVASNQFELTERPQLSGDKLYLDSPVVIDRNGMRLSFRTAFTNKGPTRAVRVFGAAQVFPLQISGPEPAQVRDQVCKLAEERAVISKFALTVYPGQLDEIGYSMPINRRDLDDVVRRTGSIVPAIVACVAYRPIFNNKSVYHTGFAKILTFAKGKVIIPTDGTIPIEALDLRGTGVTPEISPD
jgi:hypothetical protein